MASGDEPPKSADLSVCGWPFGWMEDGLVHWLRAANLLLISKRPEITEVWYRLTRHIKVYPPFISSKPLNVRARASVSRSRACAHAGRENSPTTSRPSRAMLPTPRRRA